MTAGGGERKHRRARGPRTALDSEQAATSKKLCASAHLVDDAEEQHRLAAHHRLLVRADLQEHRACAQAKGWDGQLQLRFHVVHAPPTTTITPEEMLSTPPGGLQRGLVPSTPAPSGGDLSRTDEHRHDDSLQQQHQGGAALAPHLLHRAAQQHVELLMPRRGVARKDLGIRQSGMAGGMDYCETTNSAVLQ